MTGSTCLSGDARTSALVVAALFGPHHDSYFGGPVTLEGVTSPPKLRLTGSPARKSSGGGGGLPGRSPVARRDLEAAQLPFHEAGEGDGRAVLQMAGDDLQTARQP